MNRRSFIYRASGITLCLPAFARKPDLPYLDRIGLQLYTAAQSDQGRSEQNHPGSGQNRIQTSRTIRVSLSSRPSTDYAIPRPRHAYVNSSHFDWNSLLAPGKKGVQPFEKILETARKHKLTDLVVPYLHEVDRADLTAYAKTAETLNKGAALAKKAGIRLAYHNHAFEFKPMHKGKTGYTCSSNPFPRHVF